MDHKLNPWYALTIEPMDGELFLRKAIYQGVLLSCFLLPISLYNSMEKINRKQSLDREKILYFNKGNWKEFLLYTGMI